jgi:selenocysteine lyase/cysteine desulfurase
LRAAIEFVLDVGVERIAPLVQARADQIAAGARRKGYELLGSRTAENGAGIVSFRKAGIDFRELYETLKARQMVVAPRSGWIRASPHFYISSDDIERFLDALP